MPYVGHTETAAERRSHYYFYLEGTDEAKPSKILALGSFVPDKSFHNVRLFYQFLNWILSSIFNIIVEWVLHFTCEVNTIHHEASRSSGT